MKKFDLKGLHLPSFKNINSISVSGFMRSINSRAAAMSPEDKKKSYISTAAIIVMGAASVYTFYNFTSVMNLGFEKSAHEGMPRMNVEVKRRAESLNAKYEAFITLREQSPELAALEESVGRSPIAQVTPPPKSASETSVPDFIPTVKIKALIVLGEKSVCTLDIDGEEAGQILQQGASFGGGKGKILSIDPKGVSWQWANKKYRTEL